MVRGSTRGGIHAIRGFDYQATVILDRLFAHFDAHGAGATVRPEEIDDLDLVWIAADGVQKRRFEQIKKPREDRDLNPTGRPWTLAEVARDLLPDALSHLEGNTHEQVWILGDGVETEVAALVVAGQTAPERAPSVYWRTVHLLARDEALKVTAVEAQVRASVLRWSAPSILPLDRDAALYHLMAEFRQYIAGLAGDPAIGNAYSTGARRIHALLPDVLARLHIESLFGSEEEVARRVRECLEHRYGLHPSVVGATLFRNLRGFINDISKQPGRWFDQDEFDLELRSVWPTMMPIREPPILDDGHIPRADLSAQFTVGWSGRALEAVGVSGAGKTMLAAEVFERSRFVDPDRVVFYAEVRPETALRDVLVGAAFHLRRFGVDRPFAVGVRSMTASATAMEQLAEALSSIPRSLLLLIDLVQGTCNEAFARDLATFVRSLDPPACRIAVLGQESAFRQLTALDRGELGVRSLDVRGFNVDEFITLALRRHPGPNHAHFHEVFRRVTAGRAAGLYAKLALSLANAPSLEAMTDLSRRPADEILERAEQLKLSDDTCRQGALRFVDEAGAVIRGEAAEAVPRLIDLQTITGIARAYEQGKEISARDLQALAGAGGSGGARPKANVIDGEVLWIAKFTSVHDQQPIERVEVATLRLAQACGIRTPEVRLELADTPFPVALLQRFDRRGSARIPYISARTALGKTGMDLGAYTEIVDFMRTASADPKADFRELYSRLVFTILVSNKDDHLKNHGFLYVGGGRWRLSPVFDVNPAPDRNPHLETAILEGGAHDRSIRLALDACDFFEIAEPDARGIIRDIAQRISDGWREALCQVGVTGSLARDYEPAFLNAETEIALAL